MTDRLVYRFDAIAAITMGSALLVVATPLTTLAGWSLPPAFLFGVGLFLVPWAGFNAWVSGQPSVPLLAALVHLTVDGLWVMGSVALLVAHGSSMTLVGIVLLIGQAVTVLGVFALKLGPVARPHLARR
ncbi:MULTISPECIES: hypothetical protein [Myxococcus]|uniref:Integral membrane protein n=1 Tax=Myxococcus llanfairpwllgwyngyllgogerychwyrndrobwllllantysiliogogogochensis TaxID=2590453 RepID=A0A540WHZ6_9BACT|nr:MULTISPECIES: hypothetical protein [Myxococcus]NTX09104.1 hypothetical protein [Myxococcus sp. CA040A]TQF08640.1 hypothetical protein FJV41_48845 [Myxococcus llanfairpwllgwyngyllgogerychwyrndrobwllllantysiliogogogochensis]